VHQRLSESIAVGTLHPGELLVVDQLALSLGVSKTPVREALRTLAREGLIRETETGLRVAPLDSAYVREVYAVRSALDSLAAEVIAPGLTDQDLRELQVAARSARPPDQEFHDILRSKCRWPYLRSLIDTVQVHRERIRRLELRESPESHQAGYREHMLILDAFKRRDAKQARALMQAHLDRLCEEVSEFADLTQRAATPLQSVRRLR
jgi:GntR family transcriptional regulator, rspAB operon transcriptional repressor